jgi:outer membrane protein
MCAPQGPQHNHERRHLDAHDFTAGLATLSALAFAPAAFAQDSASDTASGKHWAVVGGGVMLQPRTMPPGIRKVDGGLAPTISGSYFFNDNLAVELWGAADKLNHRVSGPAGKIGTVDQPLALSAQYHFGPADAVFRPFVGAGYYESNFTHEKIDGLSGTGSRWRWTTAAAPSARLAWT